MKRNTPWHPKTEQLMRRLKVTRHVAVGLLELLWHFAAQYAPQGDVGRFSHEDLASALDWRRPPNDLINALVDTRWLERHSACGLLIHDWKEHADQGVHMTLRNRGLEFIEPDEPCSTFSGEARTVHRTAPYGDRTDNQESTRQDGDIGRGNGSGLQASVLGSEGSDARARVIELETPERLMALWNERADTVLSRVKSLEGARRKHAREALKIHPLAEWVEVIDRINASHFCLGRNSQNWRASFDFLIRPESDRSASSATKILEGKYDDTVRERMAHHLGAKGAEDLESVSHFMTRRSP